MAFIKPIIKGGGGADNILNPDYTCEMPSDFLGASTKYRYLSSNNDIFLSYNVSGSNTYKLNKTTSSFDNIYDNVTGYFNTWAETPNGKIMASGSSKGIFQYDETSNYMVLCNTFCEYFKGDGETVKFNFRWATTTYSNPKVYFDGTEISTSIEDGVDEHTGNGSIMYLLNRTPLATSPTTTDFRVIVNGNEVPNPSQINFSYIWQSGAERHSIVFPTGNQYIPEEGDTVEIIYDMVNWTNGKYYVQFDFVPTTETEIVVTYEKSSLLTYIFATSGKGELFASVAANILLRYNTTCGCFEVIKYVSSSGAFTYRLTNTRGDTVWSSTMGQGGNMYILPYGYHSIPAELETTQYPTLLMTEGYDNEIWFMSSSSYSKDRGIARYDANNLTMTQWYKGVYGGAGYVPDSPIIHPTTHDVLINSMNRVFLYTRSTDTMTPEQETNYAYKLRYIPYYNKLGFMNGTWNLVNGPSDYTNIGGYSSYLNFFGNSVALFVQYSSYIYKHNEGTTTWTSVEGGYSYGNMQDSLGNYYYSDSNSYAYMIPYNATTKVNLDTTGYNRIRDTGFYETSDYTFLSGTENANYGFIVFKKSDNTFKKVFSDFGTNWIVKKATGNKLQISSNTGFFGLYEYDLDTDEYEMISENESYGGLKIGTANLSYSALNSEAKGGRFAKILCHPNGKYRLYNSPSFASTSLTNMNNSKAMALFDYFNNKFDLYIDSEDYV